MEPKTKLQHEVVGLSNKLKPISARLRKWALLNCLDHIAYKNKGGRISCLDCGHQWKDPKIDTHKQKAKCPNCKVKLTIMMTQERNNYDRSSFTTIEVHGRFQVIRYFHINAKYVSGEPMYVDIYKVFEIWMLPDGKYEIMSLIYNYYSGEFSGTFEIRKNAAALRYNFFGYRKYPVMKVLPEIERNGFKGDFGGCSAFTYFRQLLTVPRFETLVKTGQTFILSEYAEMNAVHKDEYWPIIKVCIKEGYIIPSFNMWKDYIGFLKYYKKDLFDPKLVCPKDLNAAHNWWMEKKQRTLERKLSIDKKRRAAQLIIDKEMHERNYLEKVRPYKDLHLQDDEISITVMQDMEQVKKEGEELYLCFVSSSYHIKENYLLLSVRVHGELTAAIGIELLTMEIDQIRAYDNGEPKKYKRILKLMQSNLRTLSNLKYKKKKSKKQAELV